MRIWKRPHRHDWRGKWHYSGAAAVSSYRVCDCGAETPRELSAAGFQQVGWWMRIHPEWDVAAISNGVAYGWLPYPVDLGVQPDGTIGRLLTVGETDDLITQQGAWLRDFA